MKILLDMNISPDWCEIVKRHGWECTHWKEVGAPQAADTVILTYAKEHGYVLLTHDLDFSAILAATKTRSPSVFQIRAQDLMSDRVRTLAIETLSHHQSEIEAGALVVLEEFRSRVRILPLT